MNKNQNKIVMVLLILTSTFFNANATEVFKSKAAGGGVNEFKQYSMCRNNLNNGFLYAGTSKNIWGDDAIHIIKTDNALNTVWSFTYMEVQQHSLNATKIINNATGNGYWISGYWGDGGGFYPFVMQIDELGIVTMHNMGNTKGVFLDVAPTIDGGCIAVGFLSDNIQESVPTSRRGFVAKFSAVLAINWTNVFHTNTRSITDNNFFECGENVTVINNAYTGNVDTYFITGSVSDIDPNTGGNVPNLFYMYLNNTGGLNYKFTSLRWGVAYDVAYDAADHSVYYIGRWDKRNIDQAAVIGKIDVASGILNYQKLFEGSSIGFPFPHSPVPYKIEVDGGQLMVFGYVRAYVYSIFPSSISSDDLVIPFHAVLNKMNASQVSFTLNHTDINRTNGYPSQNPGLLNAWDNVSAAFTASFPSFYVPEIAAKYKDILNNTQWGMIGYSDQSGAPLEYDLQLISSEGTGECYPYEYSLDFYNESQVIIDTHYVPISYDAHIMYIQKNTLNCSDETCRP
ncbi:MAG: hypothetical protein PSX81_06110 [bacterium]|nr:hypothetical protein [bacterium]